MGSLIDKIVAMDCTFFIYRIAEYKNTQKREHILTHMTKTIQKKPKPIHTKKKKTNLFYTYLQLHNLTHSQPFLLQPTLPTMPTPFLNSLYLYIFTQTLTYTSQHNTNH